MQNGSYLPIAALLSLTLISGAAVAQEEGLLSDRGTKALGISVLSPDKAGISIWRVRPTTM